VKVPGLKIKSSKCHNGSIRQVFWVYKHIFNYLFTGIYPRHLENTIRTPRKLKATDHDRYESELPCIGPTILQETAYPKCWIESLVGEPGDRVTVPLGRERLKVHFALSSAREIQNNAHADWKKA